MTASSTMQHVPPVPQFSLSACPMPTAGEHPSLEPEPSSSVVHLLPFPTSKSMPKQKYNGNAEEDKLGNSSRKWQKGETRARKARKCTKCGAEANSSATCKGTGPGGMSKCENVCQELLCKGRDSRNRKRKCENTVVVNSGIQSLTFGLLLCSFLLTFCFTFLIKKGMKSKSKAKRRIGGPFA